MIDAREIDRTTVTALIELEVRDAQKFLVAANAATIAQAHYMPHEWLRGLWRGDTPVGLIGMVDLRPEDANHDPTVPANAAYPWRLMVGPVPPG